MLHTSIGIGISIGRGQCYWILGALLGIVLTLMTICCCLQVFRTMMRLLLLY